MFSAQHPCKSCRSLEKPRYPAVIPFSEDHYQHKLIIVTAHRPYRTISGVCFHSTFIQPRNKGAQCRTDAESSLQLLEALMQKILSSFFSFSSFLLPLPFIPSDPGIFGVKKEFKEKLELLPQQCPIKHFMQVSIRRPQIWPGGPMQPEAVRRFFLYAYMWWIHTILLHVAKMHYGTVWQCWQHQFVTECDPRL